MTSTHPAALCRAECKFQHFTLLTLMTVIKMSFKRRHCKLGAFLVRSNWKTSKHFTVNNANEFKASIKGRRSDWGENQSRMNCKLGSTAGTDNYHPPSQGLQTRSCDTHRIWSRCFRWWVEASPSHQLIKALQQTVSSVPIKPLNYYPRLSLHAKCFICAKTFSTKMFHIFLHILHVSK